MSSSKLLASSHSDHKKKQLLAPTSMDFLGIDKSSSDARYNFVSNTVMVDELCRSNSAEKNPRPDKGLLPVEAAAPVAPMSGGDSGAPRNVRKTVDDVWREIVGEKKSEQQPKKEMMTLEDFLSKAEEEAAGSGGAAAVVEVEEEGLSGGVYGNENNGAIVKGEGEGGFGRGTRSLSLSELLGKAAEQRERRMIKNRESAARSRERKQAYEAELESIAARLEEENDGLLREKAEHMKKRRKQLMENVIPATEKRRPPRILQKVGSM